ncbi:MAG: hypothetical protein HY077_07125 [Elusimicrobia bacterium]|nr:hypothetical protein [Elusimicrobiota bacterium]
MSSVDPETIVALAVDLPGPKRGYLFCRGKELLDSQPVQLKTLDPDDLPKDSHILFVAFPTRTYSEGLGGGVADVAPEDRRMIRMLRRRCAKLECVGSGSGGRGSDSDAGPRQFFEFEPKYLQLENMKTTFTSCMTKPNRQDFMYLATKTFGLNLAVRLFFTVAAVRKGDLPMVRAVVSTSWYQLQDAVFTVFGQTYMKFLGRMTGMLRVGPAYLGDFFFVYFQLCAVTFLNRLVLGPLGENPLVYSGYGIWLIFKNIFQGIVSGGPLTPAINKMRRTGAISHNTMMHFYQLASLTMLYGLFADYGHQRFYDFLTGATLVLSWSSYAVFSLFFSDPPFGRLEDQALLGRLEKAAASAE